MKPTIVFLILFSVYVFAVARRIPNSNSTTELSFSFHATNLSGCGLTGCDASVTILCSSISSDWKECDKTRVIRYNNNPVWPKIFKFDHTNGTRQRWRLDLKDHRIVHTKLIASFYVNVDEYVEDGQEFVEFATPNNRGSLWIQRK